MSPCHAGNASAATSQGLPTASAALDLKWLVPLPGTRRIILLTICIVTEEPKKNWNWKVLKLNSYLIFASNQSLVVDVFDSVLAAFLWDVQPLRCSCSHSSCPVSQSHWANAVSSNWAAQKLSHKRGWGAYSGTISLNAFMTGIIHNTCIVTRPHSHRLPSSSSSSSSMGITALTGNIHIGVINIIDDEHEQTPWNCLLVVIELFRPCLHTGHSTCLPSFTATRQKRCPSHQAPSL